MVNTERRGYIFRGRGDYNILNIVVNTEHILGVIGQAGYYNILNIVVNTERYKCCFTI